MSEQIVRQRVLIVDDAEDVRETLRWALEEVSTLEVIGEAKDGFAAINQTIGLEPDIVILDILLPGIDGYMVARVLKSLPHPPRVVFLSIHNEPGWKDRALRSGGDAFVAKSEGWGPLIEQLLASSQATLL